jgi:hypothetical protein
MHVLHEPPLVGQVLEADREVVAECHADAVVEETLCGHERIAGRRGHVVSELHSAEAAVADVEELQSRTAVGSRTPPGASEVTLRRLTEQGSIAEARSAA